MPIYKYVTPARIDILRNGRVRFTQAAALNDPFEAHPCLIEFRKSMEDRARRQVKSLESKFDAHSIVVGNFIIPKMVRDGVAKFQGEIAAEYPMLSLTRKRNNPLMWSHYADSHRGFVIGFDSDNPFFHREKPRTTTPVDEVTYSDKRPVMPPFEKSNPESVYEMFLTKGDEWAYEEELRMFAQPKAANAVERDTR